MREDSRSNQFVSPALLYLLALCWICNALVWLYDVEHGLFACGNYANDSFGFMVVGVQEMLGKIIGQSCEIVNLLT